MKKSPPSDQDRAEEVEKRKRSCKGSEDEFMALQHKALRELGGELMGRIEEGKAGEMEMQQLEACC